MVSRAFFIFNMTSSAFSLSYNLVILSISLPLLLAPNQHYAEAAVTCNEVYSDLYPCVSYIMNGGSIPATCCNGINSLTTSATTTTNRRAVCRGIQSATSGVSFTSYSLRLAAALPARCGIRVQFNPATDCNMIP